MSATVTVECVICKHRETIQLTTTEPHCAKCLGPVIVKNVKLSTRRRTP